MSYNMFHVPIQLVQRVCPPLSIHRGAVARTLLIPAMLSPLIAGSDQHMWYSTVVSYKKTEVDADLTRSNLLCNFIYDLHGKNDFINSERSEPWQLERMCHGRAQASNEARSVVSISRLKAWNRR
jgi:hypothetical protein